MKLKTTINADGQKLNHNQAPLEVRGNAKTI